MSERAAGANRRKKALRLWLTPALTAMMVDIPEM